MDADKFWAQQIKKNHSAAPKYQVCTDADTSEDEFMSAWLEKWSEQFAYFNNTGCGCCVNFYEFDAPAEAVAEIPGELLEAMNKS